MGTRGLHEGFLTLCLHGEVASHLDGLVLKEVVTKERRAERGGMGEEGGERRVERGGKEEGGEKRVGRGGWGEEGRGGG